MLADLMLLLYPCFSKFMYTKNAKNVHGITDLDEFQQY